MVFKRRLVVPLTVFLVTRVLLLVAGYTADVLLPGLAGPHNWHPVPENLWLDLWLRFDAGWYSGIALGYEGIEQTAFFPLYPLLIRWLSPLVGHWSVAGVVISNVALLGALVYLHALAELESGDRDGAMRAIVYLVAFPTAFFFSAVYTESLFLLVSVAAVYHARRSQWGWSALFGTAAAATRFVGILIWAVVMLEWMQAQGWSLGTVFQRRAWVSLWQGVRTNWRQLLVLQIMPLGLLSYIFYLQRALGDPLAFLHAQQNWEKEVANPVQVLTETISFVATRNLLRGDGSWRAVLEVAAVALVLALFIPVWRRFRASYALYMLASLLVPLSTSTVSINRYIVVLFPMYLILAHWGRRPLFDRLLIMSFAVFLGVLFTGFVNWVFVA